jgi:hypothetical protein
MSVFVIVGGNSTFQARTTFAYSPWMTSLYQD